MLKRYENGREFYEENKFILEETPLDTSFFLCNARSLTVSDNESYALKAYDGLSYLLALKVSPFNLLLYGNRGLCEELAEAMCRYNLMLEGGILAERDLALSFLKHYEKRRGGSHTLHLSMDIMYAKSCFPEDTSAVTGCGREDIAYILKLRKNFMLEATGVAPDQSEEEQSKVVEKAIGDYYCIRDKDIIISIAKKVRSEDKMCSISMVYTLPEYRGRGFSRKIVTKITQDILSENKIPYLYVNKKNPISNHLYKSIGYRYGNSKYEYRYKKE